MFSYPWLCKSSSVEMRTTVLNNWINMIITREQNMRAWCIREILIFKHLKLPVSWLLSIMKLLRISLFKCCHFSDKWNSCCICIFFFASSLNNLQHFNSLNSFLMAWPLKIFSISSSNFNLCHVLGFMTRMWAVVGINLDIIRQFDTCHIPQLNINP